MTNDFKIAVIGLGYVGLPLAVEFSKKYPTIGFDINKNRISELNKGHDSTLEVEDDNLQSVLLREINNDLSKNGLYLTSDYKDLINCNIFIITVPTPTDKNNRPVLTPLIKASETVGSVLKKDDIVIYESTVYPGATEEDCVPVLENVSKLRFNTDFYVGYSPERINPGDKEHTVTKIKKVTSGSTLETGLIVDELYKTIITAGTHLAPSIKVAEAAKVIENSQRDINIAFVNELSKIFSRLNIDTNDVLEAAGTKWNFLPFRPGLVGGHCIGVDPFYLAQKAQEVGYHPEIILAGRRMNDSIGGYVANEAIKLMISNNININNSNVLILGITFKENCPDIRNSRVIDIINELKSYNVNIDVYDPWANKIEVKEEYGIELISDKIDLNKNYELIVLAVAHQSFLEFDIDKHKSENSVVFDIKSFFPKERVDGRL